MERGPAEAEAVQGRHRARPALIDNHGTNKSLSLRPIITIDMLMPAKQNSFTHIRVLLVLTATFWPSQTSVVDGRICPSMGGPPWGGYLVLYGTAYLEKKRWTCQRMEASELNLR